MAPNEGDEAPIYAGLIGEHGDVLAEARRAAEEAERSTSRTLHFGGPAEGQPAGP